LIDKFWNDQYNIIIFWNERYKIARPKAFDLDKALVQALRLFWRKGYAATSVEDLTTALNLSRSSLYDTFGDKRTLFLTVLKLYSERVVGSTAKTLHESESPVNGIQTLFDGFIAGIGQESGAMGCFMINSIAELVPYDPDVTEIAAAYNAAILGLLTEALTNAGKYEQPEAIAAYVFNVIQGMRVLIKSGATREQVGAIAAITLSNLG
jgi:TetR/AcrR family transcriptional repressor of nem operon